MRQALIGLSPAQQEVLVAYYYAGIEVQEIATRSGCTPHAIHVRVSRARQSLRRALQEDKAQVEQK